MRDRNLMDVIDKRIEKTKHALEKNGFEVYTAKDAEDVCSLVRQLVGEGSVVGVGGSMTLEETGIIKMLREGNYDFLDRAGLKGDEVKKCYRASFSADVYISGTNAVTENGELFNVDANGNRVGCICYGPDSVIIIAGCNKIVSDLDEAVRRVKKVASPANTRRLGCETYCSEKGECMACATGDTSMTAGCRSDSRICCSYVVTGYQRVKGRIKVILASEEFGY